MKRLRRWALIGAATIAGTLTVPPVQAQAQDTDDPNLDDVAQMLAERYVPVMMLQSQPEPCSPEGEPFVPMPVDAVLDNPEVALRQLGEDGLVVKWAPSATDLFQFGPSFYLDFPGSALRPGCGYEQDVERYLAELQPTVYAHIATQPDEPGVIALQYWFYWYYNDWNNKHESDWEGIQLLFRAASVDEALRTAPDSIGYAQHTGGERAEWSDEKLQRDGDRPVVYTSMRSHASYYADEVFLGRGASEGFGCDDTTGPSTRVDPAVVLVPNTIEEPDDPMAWLEFEGRWGERHGGAYDSPTGLQSKGRWTTPVDWHEKLRDGSVTVPAGDTSAGEVVDAFCGVVKWGSGQALRVQLSPLRVLLTVAFGLAAIRFLIGRTSWATVTATPIVRRRRIGEIGKASIARFRSDPRTFLALGLLAVPVVIVAGVVVSLARALPIIGDLLDLSDAGGGATLLTSIATSGLASAAAFTLVIAAVAHVLHRADGGVDATAADAVAGVRSRLPHLGVGFGLVLLTVVGLVGTVLLAPLAIWPIVRWQFAPQAVMLDDRSVAGALGRSWQLTRRRWWHTLLATGLANACIVAAGLVVALLVLTLFPALPLWFLTVVITAVGAVVMPLAAIAVTLLYGDAVAESSERTESRDDAPSVAAAPT